jgi:hypothetical protein
MRHRRVWLVVSSWLAAWGPNVLIAQDVPIVEAGARIRLTMASGARRVAGWYEGRSGDWIEVRLDRPKVSTAIALDSVRRIEVSRGRRTRMGKGALVGAAIGGASFGLLALTDPGCRAGQLCPFEGAEWDIAGIAAGAGVGALVGVLVGAIGQEAWAPATVQGWSPIVTATRDRVGLGWRVALHR